MRHSTQGRTSPITANGPLRPNSISRPSLLWMATLVTLACLFVPVGAACAKQATVKSLNVKGFGATGNGVTDDTQSIRRAAKAAVRQKKTLRVPAGTYKITSLDLPDGLVLRGDGAKSWLQGRLTVGSGSALADVKLGVDGSALKFTPGVAHTSFNRVVFTGGGPMSGDGSVIQMVGRGGSFITFRDCTIEGNPDDGNGVSMTPTGWSGGTYHDIRFQGCTFRSTPRMAFECTQRRDGQHQVVVGYHDIDLIDCVFEPSGSECISFDDATSAGAGSSTVSGCTIKGSGWNHAYPWGQGVEFNRVKGMSFVNNKVYRCRTAMINQSGLGATSCDVLYRGNTFDSTVSFISVETDHDADVIYLSGVTGATFQDNTVTSAAGGVLLGLIASSRNMFSGNTWTDTRPASSAGPCVYAMQGSSANVWDGDRFASENPYGLCRFTTNSDRNVLKDCSFVTAATKLVVADPGLAVQQIDNVSP